MVNQEPAARAPSLDRLHLQIGQVVTVAGRKAVVKRAHAADYVEVRFEDTGDRVTVPAAQVGV